ncbi:DUF952 domain-containing protein [Parvularcula sp. ZS-1/3]|uniref:DUF952 domain-containing protein n=1 Tax=Parvularcula mediterranea TaxID=2732508 RepID=A0A7Y3W632_9PROT|nr:DUF952 domain-containing protein [Parvularcula mediterranea]NNU17274.1 DUF952 domain-containing protein [Parvularcula mediterranea]
MSDRIIYKIFRPAEWEALKADGETIGAPIDIEDGYIHFSTAAQTGETLAKHFRGAGPLVLAFVDTSALPDALRWEPSRGGQLFPHLYAKLPLAAVVRSERLVPGEDGAHRIPELGT